MAISVGNKLELIRLENVIKNDAEKKVYISKVYDILPKRILQIAMPILEGKIVPLEVDGKYYAVFYTDKGLLSCNVIVSQRYKSGNLFFVDIKLLSEPAKVQRREYYRYNCKLEAKYRAISVNEYETGVPDNAEIPEDDLPWEQSVILDISGGGLRAIQKENVERGTVIRVKFSLSISDKVHTFRPFAKVLSSTLKEGRIPAYEVRMKFLKIRQEDRDDIIRFIFESERAARAKESGRG